MRAKPRFRSLTAHLLALSAAGALVTACGSDSTGTTTGSADAAVADDSTQGDAGTDAGADILPPGTKVIVDLVVDADRDGVADLANANDQTHGNAWTNEFGASFLANLDDDDGDKIEDVLDLTINGDDDALDLAPIQLAAWKDAPDGVVGVLQLDHPEKARLWKKSAAGWELVAGINNECTPKFSSCTGDEDTCQDTVQKAGVLTAAELRAGVQLGLEGRDFRRASGKNDWDGTIHVTYWVGQGTNEKVAPIPTDTLPDGKEVVQLRVAPWILNGNLTPFDTVRFADYGAYEEFAPFVNDMKAALGVAGANVKMGTYLDGTNGKKWNDAWTQDFFQTAFASIPQGKDKDGKTVVHGMRIVNARPWGRYNTQNCDPKLLPITFLRANYLGKDQGVIAIYATPDTGSSYDSHGNHDLLPAYTNGKDAYPIGRIIHGSGILTETGEFYNAQGPQGPAVEVDTSWLLVGHVDEVLSYVPAKNANGWKLLIADNNLSKKMLEKLVADGHGDARLFVGKQTYKDAVSATMVDASIAVTETLADADLMQWSQEAQAAADGVRKTVMDAIGITDADIVSMPFLTEEVDGGKIAWQPGTANMLVVGEHLEVPNPFGPHVDGVDVYAKDIQDRLGTSANALGAAGNGLIVHFVDDFESYHINEGEVHCASNPEGPPQPGWQWWLISH